MKASRNHYLVISVRLHEGRFHGGPEWPPSPARLFQALLAGGSVSRSADTELHRCLQWLERSGAAPQILSPYVVKGQTVKTWVPNNDLDSVGGDPSRVSELRTSKLASPIIFSPEDVFHYIWPLGESYDVENAEAVISLARTLYQLGRGVDMAAAEGRILDDSSLQALVEDYIGERHHPSPAASGVDGERTLLCPQPGSLSSLVARHQQSLQRFDVRRKETLFRQPPKAKFRPIAYNARAVYRCFDIRSTVKVGAFSAVPLTRVSAYTADVRDRIAERLTVALPSHDSRIRHAFYGEALESVSAIDSRETRVQIFALPSIGHEYADRAVRRLLIRVPLKCPLSPEDVFWACTGLGIHQPHGDIGVLEPSEDTTMMHHYGATSSVRGSFHYESVTPVVLPFLKGSARRTGSERNDVDAELRSAVRQALRHAGFDVSARDVHVQKEPFERKGQRAELFSTETRFAPERLWHVRLELGQEIGGPLTIGDGRYLGLGLLAPTSRGPSPLAWSVVGGASPTALPLEITTAFRRAVMARTQAVLPRREELPSYITGHERTGEPSQNRPRAYYVYSPKEEVLMLVPDYLARQQRRPTKGEQRNLELLSDALEQFTRLRAGKAGELQLERIPYTKEMDSIFVQATTWRSQTPYVVNRHYREKDAHAAVIRDVEESLRTAALPSATVTVLSIEPRHSGALSARLEISFATAVRGPLILGRTRFLGGGLFEPVP